MGGIKYLLCKLFLMKIFSFLFVILLFFFNKIEKSQKNEIKKLISHSFLSENHFSLKKKNIDGGVR